MTYINRAFAATFIALAGGDTDTSRDYDYEYADWDAVDRFMHAFAQPLT